MILKTMLWQLPASVRSLAALSLTSSAQTCCRRYSATASPPREPLSILFCGSDALSIASLDALNEAKRTVPGLIRSIDVVHRRAKFTGRGMKTLREVPIHDFATSIDLPTHPIDTFTNWHPPPNTSLIIAVSFGLLIPPRILSHSKHGGINLHPSLLPDLRGPAPIEHAILRGRTHTGVSIQTLHPTQFDRGVVLAQTEAPGIQLTEEMTRAELEGVLATKGADMLVQVLKNGAYISPHTTTQGHDDGSGNPGSWYTGPISHAPKITKADRAIILPEHSLAHILAIHRALGDMWCIFLGERVLIHRVVSAGEEGKKLLQSQGPGMWTREGIQWPLFKAKCGGVGYVLESTYAGGKKGQGNNKVMRMLKERGGGEVSGCDVHA